ncbi:MAG: hypothetical protein ACTSQJ_07175, partial [Promethearchaeota archaeon]
MEEIRWKRDKTPYLIFNCNKCKQYLYVKTIKKKKKCLRCGFVHKVKNIKYSKNIVYGLTSAV